MSSQSTNGKLEDYLERIHDSEPVRQLQAIGALGRAKDSQAVSPLSKLLLEDSVPEVRARSAGALGQIGSATAVEALCGALVDEVAAVRQQTVLALIEIGDPRSLPALLNALSDVDVDVRRWSARAVGHLGDSTEIEALRQLESDKNHRVRDEASQAIRALQDRQRLQEQRSKVSQLRQQRSQLPTADSLSQVRLDGEIDREQLRVYRLEASLAAQQVAPPSEESDTQDRERQTVIFGLQRLIRELESLNSSVRAEHLRQVWSGQLRDAKELLEVWNDAGDSTPLEGMQEELRRLRQAKEEELVDQEKILENLIRFVEEAFNCKLNIERIYDALRDSSNRTIVEGWIHEAENKYRLIKIARDNGDINTAREHHTNLVALRRRAQEVKEQEDRDKQKAGNLVIRFILISTAVLAVTLFLLDWLEKAEGDLPALGVPYSVICWSALGSIAAMLYQFLNRPVSQLETVKWLVARPIQGIIMGSFLYLIVEGGLFILSSEQVVRTEMAAVIGFLGGFSDKFTEEMVRRATSILTQDGSEQKNTPDDNTKSAPEPTS
ncbi:HEAT repeat domain-containing protein [Chloroflexi bacterium TSY]|nr:HEAT repeat domain-containing protein [Chloroflexi bacterium TSY]